MKRVITIICSLAVVSLLFSACCYCRQAALLAAPIHGTEWTLIEYRTQPFEAGDGYRLVFNTQDSTASGRGDCNSFMSRYSLDGNKRLKINHIAITRAMCANDKMERDYLNMLEQADGYSIDGKLLMLLHEGELISVFDAKSFVPDKKAARKRLGKK